MNTLSSKFFALSFPRRRESRVDTCLPPAFTAVTWYDNTEQLDLPGNESTMNSSVDYTGIPQLESTAISDFCKRWRISELALFGSALGSAFGPDSDVDLLVTFAPDAKWGLFDHARMQQELQDIFGRDVDLVSKRAVEQSANWLRRDEILLTARVLFPAQEASHGSG